MACRCSDQSPEDACAWCYDHASPGARRRWDDARKRFLWEGRNKSLQVKGSALRSIVAARTALQEEARKMEVK